MTKYIFQIKADTNDADYVTSSTEVTLEEIQKLLPVIEAIKNCKKHHNWPYTDYTLETVEECYPNLDTNLIELFNEYCPYGENGIHTIESIIYFPTTEQTKLL